MFSAMQVGQPRFQAWRLGSREDPRPAARVELQNPGSPIPSPTIRPAFFDCHAIPLKLFHPPWSLHASSSCTYNFYLSSLIFSLHFLSFRFRSVPPDHLSLFAWPHRQPGRFQRFTTGTTEVLALADSFTLRPKCESICLIFQT